MSYFLDAPVFAADVKSWAQGVHLTESCARFNRIYFENDGAVRAFYGRIVLDVRYINHRFTRGARLNAVLKRDGLDCIVEIQAKTSTTETSSVVLFHLKAFKGLFNCPVGDDDFLLPGNSRVIDTAAGFNLIERKGGDE